MVLSRNDVSDYLQCYSNSSCMQASESRVQPITNKLIKASECMMRCQEMVNDFNEALDSAIEAAQDASACARSGFAHMHGRNPIDKRSYKSTSCELGGIVKGVGSPCSQTDHLLLL